MQDFHELFPYWLSLLDQGLEAAVNQLSGAAGPFGLVGYLPPVVLVLISRERLHLLAVIVFAFTALAALRLGGPALGLVLYATGYLTAAHAFVARRIRQRSDAAEGDLMRLELKISAFLDGLDRRSQSIDRLQPTSPAQETEREAA